MASLFDTLVVDSSKILTSSSLDGKSEKSEPSLFDSLLSDSLSQTSFSEETQNKENSTLGKNSLSTNTQLSSTENKDTLVGEEKNTITQQSSDKQVVQNQLNNIDNNVDLVDKNTLNSNISSGSLLDKLILESKIILNNENNSKIVIKNENSLLNDILEVNNINQENIEEIKSNIDNTKLEVDKSKNIDLKIVDSSNVEIEKLEIDSKQQYAQIVKSGDDIEQKQQLLDLDSLNGKELKSKNLNVTSIHIDKELDNNQVFTSLEDIIQKELSNTLENLTGNNKTQPKSLMDMLIEKNINLIENKSILTNDEKVLEVDITSLNDVISLNLEIEDKEFNHELAVKVDNILMADKKNSENITNKTQIIYDIPASQPTLVTIDDTKDLFNKLESLTTVASSDEILKETLITKPVLINEEIKEESLKNQLNQLNQANELEENKKTNLENIVDEVKSDVKVVENLIKDQLLVENSIKTEIPVSVKDVLTNIYLSSQKSNLNNQMLSIKNEAMTTLNKASTISDIEVGAELLDLGLENIEIENIEQKLEIKNDEISQQDKKINLDRLAFNKNIVTEDLKHLITKSVEASKALIENTLTKAEDVTLTLNTPLSLNINAKIVEARQQMSSLMSDISKQMYENYKPPVTVFRIHLNPGQLGSIAIMMKSEKDNAISISMSVSEDSTLQALNENQNLLRTSLSKNFEDNTKFNLDFSSSNGGESNSSSNEKGEQSSNKDRFADRIDTKTILENREDNLEAEDRRLDYM